MASEPTTTQDATTGEEIANTTIPPTLAGTTPKQRNAFTDLMSPKKPPPSKKQPHSSTPQSDPARTTIFLGSDGLGAYITDPASFPASRVIYHDDKWVVINDLYPKSSIHLLLLPRDPAKQKLHPFDAFKDVEFLKEVQAEVTKIRILAAKELHRRFGKFSKLDQEREKALEAVEDFTDTSSPDIPKGRDWSTSIISGIHANPSMNHLHVHILSIDRYSECLRHRKHYTSFSTPFFVPVEDFPLEKDDLRRHSGRERYLDRDLVCWRCKRNFGNKFTRLKEHLGEEFEAWRKE